MVLATENKTLTENQELRIRNKPWRDSVAEIDKHISEVFHSIRGLRRMDNNLIREFMQGASASYDRGWSVSCTLTVRVEKTAYNTESGSEIKTIRLWCEIGWSSSQRKITDALAAKDLYSDVISGAAEIEARWDYEYFLEP